MADNNENGGLITEKLYSPLLVNMVVNDNLHKYDDDYWCDPVPQYQTVIFADKIHGALLREQEHLEVPRGLMAYYHNSGAIVEKVRSLYMDVEVHRDRLWCVGTLQLTGTLTPGEMEEFRSWWQGQLLDGFGEGFEQQEMQVDDGSLFVSLWDTEDDNFYVATQQEFEERLGITAFPAEQSVPVAETPAQAALHEPDIYEDGATHALHQRLKERLDANLTGYLAGALSAEENSVPGMSSEIAAYAGAHYYLSEIHNFHASELEYLLKFQDPLSIVADRLQLAGMDDYSDIMWDIFDKQNELQGGGYALADDPAVVEARKRALFIRLDENLGNYCESLMGTDKAEIIGMAEEIAAKYAVRDYLKSEYDFKPGEVEYLLQFQDPLAVVSDRYQGAYFGHVYLGEAIANVFKDQQYILQYYEYTLMPEASAPVPAAENAQGTPSAAMEKPSVLEQLRRARAGAKENPVPRRQSPGKDRGPEL